MYKTIEIVACVALILPFAVAVVASLPLPV